MSSPLRPPFRNRSQTQSHLSYKPIPEFSPNTSTGWRGGEVQQKWFLLVQYGEEFLVDGEPRSECDEDESGGSLLVILQHTAHQQIIHLLSQLHLPSPLGLSVHLILPDAKCNPRLTDTIWPTFFSSYFLTPQLSQPHQASAGLPIAATVVLKIDKRKARWYDGWKRDSHDGLISKWVNLTKTAFSSEFVERSSNSIDELPLKSSRVLSIDMSHPFTDSPYDNSMDSIIAERDHASIHADGSDLRYRQRDNSADDEQSNALGSKIQSEMSPASHLEVSEEVATITLPPLSAFSTPNQVEDTSRSSTPLSFHSIPYSPLCTLPDPGALATQPFLKELYQNISITRGRSDSDLAGRRGQESLTIDTQREVRPPWADLGSTMWSAGTSWGPPTTPEGWDLSPTSRKQLFLEKAEDRSQYAEPVPPLEQIVPVDVSAPIDFSRSPIRLSAGSSLRNASSGVDSPLEEVLRDFNTNGSPGDKPDHSHGQWTFLPKGPVTPTPWEFGWPFRPIIAIHPQSHPASITTHNSASAPSETSASPEFGVSTDETARSHNREIRRSSLSFSEISQEIQFFDTQSQVIQYQLEQSFSPAPGTTQYKLQHFQDGPTRDNILGSISADSNDTLFSDTCNIHFEFDQPPHSPESPAGSTSSPVEQIVLTSLSSPYEEPNSVFLQPHIPQYEPESPFGLDIPVSPYDEDTPEERRYTEAEIDTALHMGGSMLTRASNVPSGPCQLDVIEEMSDSEVSSPVTEDVMATLPSPAVSLTLEHPPLQINPRLFQHDQTQHCSPESPMHHSEDNMSPIWHSAHDHDYTVGGLRTERRIVPALPDPHIRLSIFTFDSDLPIPSPRNALHAQQVERPSPPPFERYSHAEADISLPFFTPAERLNHPTDRRNQDKDELEGGSRFRSSIMGRMGNIKPLFRSKSQVDPSSRSRATKLTHQRTPSYPSELAHEANASMLSFKSDTESVQTVTSSTSKTPRRPMKRLSRALSGFGGSPRGGPVNPLSIMKRANSTDLNSSGNSDYPNLMIYPPRIPPVDIPIYSGIYPNLVIYPSSTKQDDQMHKQVDRDSSRSIEPIKIGLTAYRYPDISLYPPTMTRNLARQAHEIRTIPILDHAIFYPNIVLYAPLATGSTTVKVLLRPTVYPDIIIYPASTKYSYSRETTRIEPIKILLHPIMYPDLSIYPSISNISTSGQTIPVESIKILPHPIFYPNLLIYPPQKNLRLSQAQAQAPVRAIRVLLCPTNYPAMSIYPRVIPIILRKFVYPNIVIYPCCDKGVQKIKEEIINEKSHKDTQFPSTPTTHTHTPTQDPKELLIKARRSYSNLRASLDLGTRIPPLDKISYHHHRGASSISTISSVMTTGLVTPVEELPPIRPRVTPSFLKTSDLSLGMSEVEVENLMPMSIPTYFPNTTTTNSPEEMTSVNTARSSSSSAESSDAKLEGRKQRSNTLVSERLLAFSERQNLVPPPPVPYVRSSRSNTINSSNVISPPPPSFASASPRSPEAKDDGRRVGRLSRDLMKNWL
ncbi:uncharacterized protein I303_100497 [Kwoniella dejecticola CBS 10117]|uniref:Uncharacterized protein n=1 Tax=Kwoniella dejecticola CBS 10117 TaxID=1296121 RepID=A0A1A6AF32_9TREE|nr:uncharacterized protein I303_00497 [Kwoniella dejecticola CBS 10117]OBR88680.1 hypothetical protein I303_00497 [Kwoniella dejecticola CBS 10117]